MKRKEIIELAKKNGMTEFVPVGKNDLWAQIEVWVTMAIEEEREACAMLAQKTVCDTHIPTGVRIYGAAAAKAIRSRGEAT